MNRGMVVLVARVKFEGSGPTLHNTSGPDPSNVTLATSTNLTLATAYHHI